MKEINPYVVFWTFNHKESYGTYVIRDQYNPVWDEEYEFTIKQIEKNTLEICIYDEQLYPKYNPLIDLIKIPVGQFGDHISYNGPVYKDDEEVGTFSYEVDFLPIKCPDEIEDKYQQEMKKKQQEEDEQREEERRREEERKREEERRREEERKREEARKREEEEKQKPKQKIVSLPYKRITRLKKGQDERDWDWARKYYES